MAIDGRRLLPLRLSDAHVAHLRTSLRATFRQAYLRSRVDRSRSGYDVLLVSAGAVLADVNGTSENVSLVSGDEVHVALRRVCYFTDHDVERFEALLQLRREQFSGEPMAVLYTDSWFLDIVSLVGCI